MNKIDKLKLIISKHSFLLVIFILYLVLNLFGIGCIFKWFTGISCPSCGMTRATLAALRLDFKSAFYYHPLFWLIISSLLFIIHAKKPLFGNKLYQNIFIAGIFITVLAVYFFRLFIIDNNVVTIEISNGQLFLIYKKLREWIL